MTSSFTSLTAAVLLSAVPSFAQDSLPAHIVELFEAYIALPDTLVPVLKSATDKQTANNATPLLREELKKLYSIRESLQKITNLTPRQNELVRKRYEKDMRERWGNVYTEMFRLQQNRCYEAAEFARVYKIMCLMLNK